MRLRKYKRICQSKICHCQQIRERNEENNNNLIWAASVGLNKHSRGSKTTFTLWKEWINIDNWSFASTFHCHNFSKKSLNRKCPIMFRPTAWNRLLTVSLRTSETISSLDPKSSASLPALASKMRQITRSKRVKKAVNYFGNTGCVLSQCQSYSWWYENVPDCEFAEAPISQMKNILSLGSRC